MTDSVQCNNTYQQGCCKTTWAKFFPSCKCISVCSFWLSINWFCIQQPSFLLLHESVNYSHVLYPSNPNGLLIKLQFCIFHVHQRHRQTEIVHCPTWLVFLDSVYAARPISCTLCSWRGKLFTILWALAMVRTTSIITSKG